MKKSRKKKPSPPNSEQPVTITLHVGDDYAIIWKDDKQIFCYHGNLSDCIATVVESLGATFDTADADDDEFDWENVDGKTLTEFNEEVLASRGKTIREEIEALHETLRQKQSQLKKSRG